MEDPGEKASFVQESTETSKALSICGGTCRWTKYKLAMRELVRTTGLMIAVQLIILIAVMFTREEITTLQLLSVVQITPGAFLYSFMFINLFSNGWGSAEHGRFWCDVKIMYARGFNTIRTITYMANRVCCLWILALILGVNSQITLFLLPLLAVLAEWQAGLSENKNQYDVKAFDKFVGNDGRLCLESLNFFQSQKKETAKWSMPFIVHCMIKLYVISSLLASWKHTPTEYTFGIPIAIVILFYICLIPLILDFIYFKSGITFCQLELYRCVADMTAPCIIAAFALV